MLPAAQIFSGDLATTSSDGFISLEHASGNVQIFSSHFKPVEYWYFEVLPNAQSLWVNGTIAGTDAFNQGAQDLNKVAITLWEKLQNC